LYAVSRAVVLYPNKKGVTDGCPWWLTAVIRATQEARDEEDQDWKPAWANSLRDPILKKVITKKSWCSGSR
jgi:hypothetical protein